MRLLFGLLLLGLVYLLAWPVPVQPVSYTMPAAPEFVGPTAENDALSEAELVALPGGTIGPEDLAVLPDGRVYTADLAANLWRIDGPQPVLVDQLGGRPLGIDAGPDGAIYIADSFRGLLRWTGPGELEILADAIDGAPIVYANQLDVARDGTVYFSNSTDRFDPRTMGGTKPTSVLTVWEQSDAGYVARRAADGTVEKIADGFVYTNGVALSPDEDYLLIAETGRARLHRHWLKGPRAGETELFMENLPGYPDNLEPMGDGTFWLAFASPRLSTEALMPYPLARKMIWRLGPMVRPAPVERGHLIQFDETGRILQSLQDPAGHLGITTGGRPVGATLYVMTLDSPGFGRMPLDP